MRIQIIIASAFLLLIGIAGFIYEWNSPSKSEKKWLRWASRGALYWITSFPILLLFLCYLVICVLIWVEYRCGEIDLNGSTILICISIIGFVGTIIGLIVTYIQLKKNNNQFYGYYDFYRIAEELLNQKSNRTIKFFFSTPIPGHIAYNEESDVKSFLNNLLKYKGKIEFIIPDEEMITKLYYQYIDKTIGKDFYSIESINHKLVTIVGAKSSENIDVGTFIDKLRKKEKSDIYIYNVSSSDKEPEAIENLYLSDGRIAVYAIPLHFLNIQDSSEGKKDEKDTKPVLVGFITTDRNLVTELNNNFIRIRDDENNSKKLVPGMSYLDYECFYK